MSTPDICMQAFSIACVSSLRHVDNAQFLIFTGICLLGFGLNMTRREFNEIALAGLPIEGIPLCSVNPSIYYE